MHDADAGRVAVIGGLALVAAANIYIFPGTENLPQERSRRFMPTSIPRARRSR
jgi:hypothetical protein